MLLWNLSRSVSLLFLAFAAVGDAGKRPARPVTQKPINWNLSYYSEPFKHCKTMRIYNPVEQARAHGVATELFRQCGPRLIIHYATKYGFPAFAVMKSGDLICFIGSIGSAYFESSGIAKNKNDTMADRMMNLMGRLCDAINKGGFSMQVKHRNEKFVIQASMCYGFLYEVVDCAIRRVGVRDGDYAKYAVGHFIKMLL